MDKILLRRKYKQIKQSMLTMHNNNWYHTGLLSNFKNILQNNSVKIRTINDKLFVGSYIHKPVSQIIPPLVTHIEANHGVHLKYAYPFFTKASKELSFFQHLHTSSYTIGDYGIKKKLDNLKYFSISCTFSSIQSTETSYWRRWWFLRRFYKKNAIKIIDGQKYWNEYYFCRSWLRITQNEGLNIKLNFRGLGLTFRLYHNLIKHIQLNQSKERAESTDTKLILNINKNIDSLKKELMKQATKNSNYTNFSKMTAEDRLEQSQFLRKLKHNMVPVIIFSSKKSKQQLPNCKFLLQKDIIMHAQFSKIRQYIIKNKAMNSSETLCFYYNRKMLSGSKKVADFMNEQVKDYGKDDDGWLYLEYNIQDWSG